MAMSTGEVHFGRFYVGQKVEYLCDGEQDLWTEGTIVHIDDQDRTLPWAVSLEPLESEEVTDAYVSLGRWQWLPNEEVREYLFVIQEDDDIDWGWGSLDDAVLGSYVFLGSGDRLQAMKRLGISVTALVSMPPHLQIREAVKLILDAGLQVPFLALVKEFTSGSTWSRTPS